MAMVIKTPQQQQLQPERDPTMTMAMAIVTHRQQHGNCKERGLATVLYHQQQCRHICYQEHCHGVLPSNWNRNTTAAAAATTTTGTLSDNGNCDKQTTQQRTAGWDLQQSFSIINNVDASSIKIMTTMTSFPPSATGTRQQQQLQRDPTMAMTMTIMACRQQRSNRGTRATTITTMAITEYYISSSNNNNTMLDAHNSNTSNAIRQLNPSTTWTCRRWREGKDVILAMLSLIEDVVLAMVLTETCWHC